MPANDKKDLKNNKKNKQNSKNKSSAKQGNFKRYYKRASKKTIEKLLPPTPVKIGFLGGLNEVGKNMTLYEYEDDIILAQVGYKSLDDSFRSRGGKVTGQDIHFVET